MHRAVRRAIAERLATADEMADRAEHRVPLVRTEIQRITGGWRELLAAHLPDDAGRCPVCSGWVRRRRWPCPVWVAAHQQLVGDGLDSTVPAPRARDRRRPLREVEVIARPAGPEPGRANPPVTPG